MPHGFRLFQNRFVALRVSLSFFRLAAIVEQIFSLVEIFFLASYGVESCQSHLGNLVSRHDSGLSASGSHLATNAVGIALGDIEKLVAARSLIVGAGGIHHVSKVI